jgi:hypothetical protein
MAARSSAPRSPARVGRNARRALQQRAGAVVVQREHMRVPAWKAILLTQPKFGAADHHGRLRVADEVFDLAFW